MNESLPHVPEIILQSKNIEQLKNEIIKKSWNMTLGRNTYPEIYMHVVNQGRILSTMLGFMYSIHTLIWLENIRLKNILSEEPQELKKILNKIRNFIQKFKCLRDQGVENTQQQEQALQALQALFMLTSDFPSLFVDSIHTLIRLENILSEEPQELKKILNKIRNFIQSFTCLRDQGVENTQQQEQALQALFMPTSDFPSLFVDRRGSRGQEIELLELIIKCLEAHTLKYKKTCSSPLCKEESSSSEEDPDKPNMNDSVFVAEIHKWLLSLRDIVEVARKNLPAPLLAAPRP